MRADTRTSRRTGVEAEVYSDFDITFGRNPVTGALIRRTNEEAVKGAIRNIILASRGEWAHHPHLGSKVYHLLFEPLERGTAKTLEDVISAALRYEPRVNVIETRVDVNLTRDGYDVSITYQTINSTLPVTFTDFLKRVR